jgi:plasmid stabilization system protein ParE
MKLVFTDEAKADLAKIGEWIAEDNPERAFSFVSELESHCGKLVEMPRAYALVPRHESSGVGAHLTATTSSSTVSVPMPWRFFTSCTGPATTSQYCFPTAKRRARAGSIHVGLIPPAFLEVLHESDGFAGALLAVLGDDVDERALDILAHADGSADIEMGPFGEP